MDRAVISNDRGVHITLGFLLSCAVTLISVLGTYFHMQSRIDDAQRQSSMNGEAITRQGTMTERQGEVVNQMHEDIRSIREAVQYFRDAYEKDMKKYVREPGR